MLQKKVDTVPFFIAQYRVSYKENYQSFTIRNWEYQALLTFCEPRGKNEEDAKGRFLLSISQVRGFPSIKDCPLRVKDLIFNTCLHFYSVFPPLIFVSLYPQNNQRRCYLLRRLIKPPYKLPVHRKHHELQKLSSYLLNKIVYCSSLYNFTMLVVEQFLGGRVKNITTKCALRDHRTRAKKLGLVG